LILLCLIVVNIFISVGTQGNNFNSTQEPVFIVDDIAKKLDYRLQSFLNSVNIDKTSSIQIIINFQNTAIMEKGIAKINSFSSKIQFLHEWQFIHTALFKVPIEYIVNIAAFPEILKIWLDMGFYIENSQGKLPDQAQISSLIDQISNKPIKTQDMENYDKSYNGSNVIVALLDTGVDIFHPDLNKSILAFGGASLVEGDPFPLDFNGHGTFCAGIIASGGIINKNMRGVAPGSSILNVKVLSSSGFGLWSWIISGIEYAITHGADIISLCFSMPGYPNDPVNLAINAAIQRGMIVITAAGDEGPAFSSISAPGMAPTAITIGAYNDFTHAPASFSARGPTLSFYTKPDILASGVNITSCRPSIPSNLPINLTGFFQGTTIYGVPLNKYYTVVNSTSAAAANVTGVIASLVQHAKFLSAEEVKIILQQTAIPFSSMSPNIQGAGLVNLKGAHDYLTKNKLNKSLIENRLYSPTFFSPGYITTQNGTRILTMVVSSYGSLLGVIDSRPNMTFTHMIQGQLAIKYNGQLKWFSDMYLLRELHNLTSEFSRIQSILTDYSIICIFTAEAWPSINGFRVNLTIINLKPITLYNLSLYCLWQTDLFFNASIQSSHDTGRYNGTDDISYAYDSKNGNFSYIGFSGLYHSHSHEVNTSKSIREQIQKDSLLNNNQTKNNQINNAIAMEWNLTSHLTTSKCIQFSESIGIANSYTALNNSINSIKTMLSSDILPNLALLSSNMSRIGFINHPYTSDVLLMNIGNVPINNTLIVFLINSTKGQTHTIFSKFINLGRLEPFEFKWINATWNPTEVDIYSLYWILGTEAFINELILYFMNPSRKITQEQFFWDNIFIRNIFIKDNMHQLQYIFPNRVPIAPYLVYFPNDIGVFNISITTNHPLNHLKVITSEGNLPQPWITTITPLNIENFGNIQLTISIPSNPRTGFFYRKLSINADNTAIGDLWINFSIRYPSGKILFCRPSPNFSLQTSLQGNNLLALWKARLKTIYSGYFEFYNLCLQNNYDVDDFGVIKQLKANLSLDTMINLPFKLPYQISSLKQNFTFISTYDLIILSDPQANLSSNEIETLINFGKNGGGLFFWTEPENECVQYSINSILSHFGIQINKSYELNIKQSFLNPNQHEITRDLSAIKLFSFTTFSNFSSLVKFTQYQNEATCILNNSHGKILCIGDSSIFNDSCILSADNFRFLNQSINWLLKEKINISVFINKEDASAPLRMNQHLSISIHLTTINGSELYQNLTLYCLLITPSNRMLYMIFFLIREKEGWYNTLYLSQWLNETGSYFLIIYVDSPSQISTYSVQELILEPALPPSEGKGSLNRIWASPLRILIGILIALAITGVLVGTFLYQRWQWRRQMTIVELKEKLKRDISNVLSEYQLYMREIEEFLRKSQVMDTEKLRMILDKQERSKNLLKKLKKLGKHV